MQFGWLDAILNIITDITQWVLEERFSTVYKRVKWKDCGEVTCCWPGQFNSWRNVLKSSS